MNKTSLLRRIDQEILKTPTSPLRNLLTDINIFLTSTELGPRPLVSRASRFLLPLGFVEIYSINHSTPTKDEVHFIKDGIRVICKFDGEYFTRSFYKDLIHFEQTLVLQTTYFAELPASENPIESKRAQEQFLKELDIFTSHIVLLSPKTV